MFFWLSAKLLYWKRVCLIVCIPYRYMLTLMGVGVGTYTSKSNIYRKIPFLDFISMFKVFVYGVCYIYKFKYGTNDFKMNNEIIFYFLLKAKKKCLQFQDKLSWSTIHDVYLMFYVCYEIKVFKKKTFVLFKSPTTSTHGEISMPCCHMNFKRHIV